MIGKMWLSVCSAFLVLAAVSGDDGNGSGRPVRDEVRLLQEILDESHYDTAARPVLHQDHPVNVTMGMSLAQIIDMDEKNQIVTLNGFFRFYWVDPYLTWDPAKYGGIDVIRVPWERIWFPDIALYSSLDEERRATELFTSSNAMVRSDGNVAWMVPAVLRSSCKVNVEYFPFDQQKCFLKFGSWTHDGNAMNFTAQAKTASMDLFIENEQWELHSALLDRKENFYPCCPDTPFYDIMLTLTIIRKPMFALFYYVWPSLLLLIIGIMVFFLPAESGEKVSLGITVLLSLTVYQLLLSDIVPRTSEVVPVLGKFVGAAVFFLSFSTMGAVVLVNFHFRGDKGQRVPKWMRQLILVRLATILCVRRNVTINDHAETRRDEEGKELVAQNGSYQPGEGQVSRDQSETLLTSGGEPREPPREAAEMRKLITHVREMRQNLERRQDESDDLERTKAEWDSVSFVLDRGFLYLLCIIVFILCLIVFLKKPEYG